MSSVVNAFNFLAACGAIAVACAAFIVVCMTAHASGSFANALARLRSLEAAEGYGSQGVKAADVFFA